MSVTNESVDAGVERAISVLSGRSLAFLTGAGISTDSGIPAYRGAGAPPRTPMQAQVFLGDELARQRYWLGGHLGWRRFTAAQPNAGHLAVAELEQMGVAKGVVTQNVDGLHVEAGSSHVVELHGNLRNVICLDCGQLFARESVAAQMDADNPWVEIPENITLNPDGDVSPESSVDFVIPVCTVCGGRLKPDVVFFGEYVPLERFRTAESLVRASNALVVAGSSLVVNSGIRLIDRARRRRIPLVIINREPTKADRWADVVIRGGTSEVLTTLREALG